ncbi:AMP-binding protein [Streptomyces sp. NPDC003011]
MSGGPYRTVRVPPEAARMYDCLTGAARTSPDAPAVVEYAGEGAVRLVTYGQLRQRTEDAATALTGAGLGVGDRVMVESDISAPAVALFLACSKLGLLCVPVTPGTAPHRLAGMVDAVQPALYLRAGGVAVRPVAPPAGTGRFGPAGVTVERPPHRPPGWSGWRRSLETDPAYLVFTSSALGRPAGVVMSHGGLGALHDSLAACDLVGGGDRVVTTARFGSAGCLTDICLALGGGAAIMPVPPALLHWPGSILRFLETGGATVVSGPASVWQRVLRQVRRPAGLDRLRTVLLRDQEFPLPELRQLQTMLPRARVTHCYGHAESPVCAFTDIPRPLPENVRRLPVGTVRPGVEMVVVDEDEQPIDDCGVVGELYVRSPMLFTAYWGDPEATSEVLVPDPVNRHSGQTVLRTGDLACLGKDGQLYLHGRSLGGHGSSRPWQHRVDSRQTVSG